MKSFCVVLLASLLLPSLATAQDSTQTGAHVVYRGDTLFALQTQFGPFTPQERADAIARRLGVLAEDPLFTAERLIVVDSAGTTDIRGDSLVIMTVTSRDAAEAGVTRAELAQVYLAAMQETITRRQPDASLKGILVGTGLTLLATLALAAVLWVFNRVFPAFYARIEKAAEAKRIPAIRIQRVEFIPADRVGDALVVMARVLRFVLVLGLFYVYLPLVLSFFPWTRRLSGNLVGYVLDPLEEIALAFLGYLPSLITVAVIVAVVFYLLKFIHLFFRGIQRGAISFPGFYRDWAEPTFKIVRFLIIVLAIVFIYPHLPGSDTIAFKGVSVFIGALLSFGSSSAIANVIAGVVLTYMRPFQVGDRVRIADTFGDVVEKTLLVTRVRTIKNVDITVANQAVLSSHIINYSSSAAMRGVIMHTSVTIGYDVDWKQVHELLLSAVDGVEDLVDDPAPFVLQTALGDFAVTYELNAYTNKPNQMARIYSELHQRIQDSFREANVEIMSPTYAALRDGNRSTVPGSEDAGAFRVASVDGKRTDRADAAPPSSVGSDPGQTGS